MSSVLDKRTAIVELLKANNYRQDISKSLKINRMFVWKTLKRYEETGDIHNRPGQGRPRTIELPNWKNSPEKRLRETPRDPSRIWQKSPLCRMEPCQLFSGRTWRCPHSSMSRNTNFLLKLLTNGSKNARFFFPVFKMTRCQTSFSVMRRNSILNTT